MPDIPRTFYQNIEILARPSSPSHAATLGAVEEMLHEYRKPSVTVADFDGLTGTYAPSPDFALTADADGPLPDIDGVTLAANDRVLLTAQADARQNGVYIVTALGDVSSPWVLTRAADWTAGSVIRSNVLVGVLLGDAYHDTDFRLTTDGDSLTVDADEFAFEPYAGRISRVESKTFAIAGDNAAETFAFAHGFNTYAVSVTVIRDSDRADVLTGVRRVDLDNVEISFASAPALGAAFTVIVSGLVSPV
jgi:hypothetical protein